MPARTSRQVNIFLCDTMRLLYLTDTCNCRSDKDSFYIFDFLFNCLLGYVNNELYAFVDDIQVTDSKARALADAIESIERNEEWEIGLYILLSTEQEIESLCSWLREGGFVIEPL